MTKLIADVKEILKNKTEENYTIADVVEDLCIGGCESGLINELISYTDTTAFYNTHEDDIEEIIDDMVYNEITSRDAIGGDFWTMQSYKNRASWIAFEHVAFDLLP